MNIVDIGILICILFFIILGYRDGFLKKVFGILGIVGGLILATKYMALLADLISEWLTFSQEISLIIAFFSIFMFVIVAVNLSFRWFGRSSSESLKLRSRFAGAILGGCQGLVAVSLILLMLSIFDFPSDESCKESVFYDGSIHIAPAVFDYTTQWMPTSKAFFEELAEKIEKFRTSH